MLNTRGEINTRRRPRNFTEIVIDFSFNNIYTNIQYYMYIPVYRVYIFLGQIEGHPLNRFAAVTLTTG